MVIINRKIYLFICILFQFILPNTISIVDYVIVLLFVCFITYLFLLYYINHISELRVKGGNIFYIAVIMQIPDAFMVYSNGFEPGHSQNNFAGNGYRVLEFVLCPPII